jgi:fibronectin type 3 domain-containing protein
MRTRIAMIALVWFANTGTFLAAPHSPKKHSVKLTWLASPSTVDGYNIYRSTSPNGPFTKISTEPVHKLSFVDRDVESGNHYFYVVRATSKGTESVGSNRTDAVIP